MWMSAACVFVLLMGTLSYIQFFDSKTLMNNQWNSRALYDNYGSARGSIVVDGTEIASSVKSDDEYNYQRVYNHPLKYAALTGYFSTIMARPAWRLHSIRSLQVRAIASSTTVWRSCLAVLPHRAPAWS